MFTLALIGLFLLATLGTFEFVRYRVNGFTGLVVSAIIVGAALSMTYMMKLIIMA